MSIFSSDEVKTIFELAMRKESADRTLKKVATPDLIEAIILVAAKDMEISETAIWDTVKQLLLWKELKQCRKFARILRGIGVTALIATSSLGLGWWVLPAGVLSSSLFWSALIALGVVALTGSPYRKSYRKYVQLEMELGLDDGKQISEELAWSLDRHEYQKQQIAIRQSGAINFSTILSGLLYLLASPTPTIIRYEIKRDREEPWLDLAERYR